MSFQKAASIVLHVVILAVFTYCVHGVARVRKAPARNAVVVVAYAPGHQVAVERPKPKIVPLEKPKIAVRQPEPPPPSSGGDPSGESDVTVAEANFDPAPKPDLSALPHGTRGDVLIDIVIDEDGKVVDTHVDQGLGHGVDEAVLAVVETWTFTPATKAGKPVASKQQLLFHFERA
ncbi:MAG: energy transducer TonB [Terracidiphilus sp.]